MSTFVVVWTRGSTAGGTTLLARSVVAQAGGLSPAVIIASGASFPYTVDNLAPRVGGDARLSPLVGLSHNDAIVVWQEVGPAGSRIRACEVLCAPLAVPVMTTLPFYVSTASTNSSPDITRHGGTSGQWLVAWDRAFAGHVGRDIMARVIGSNGTLCTLETAVTFTTSSNEERPSVAREMQSEDFMVVFQQESNLGSGDFGIQCRGVSFNGSCFGGGNLAMTTAVMDFAMQPAVNEINPVVEFAQSKYMVVWAQEDMAGNAHLRLRNVAPDTCASCGPTWSVGTGSADARNPAIGAQNSSSLLGGDEALIVWNDAGNDDIRGQRAAALGAGGAVLPYAPSCGGGGVCGTSGPSTLGNLNFAITLTGADPAAQLAYLALSPAALNFPCGSCTLVPTLDFVFVPLPVTNGSATLPLPLPCHPAITGISIYAQWVVLGTSASPCSVAPNASLSSAVRIFIVA